MLGSARQGIMVNMKKDFMLKKADVLDCSFLSCFAVPERARRLKRKRAFPVKASVLSF
jgi:hypothetical protein